MGELNTAVSPQCPALRHNTLTAAIRGIRGKAGAARCVCPRALELREAELARQRELRRASGRATVPGEAGRGRAGEKYAKTVRQSTYAPNLYGAPCTTPAGLRLLERATNRGGPDAPKAREEFKRICREVCPKLAECETWVLSAESAPGSWGGIYAGLTVGDRRRLANQ